MKGTANALKNFYKPATSRTAASAGIVPVSEDKLLSILNEEHVQNPEFWISTLIDFGMLQSHGYNTSDVTYGVNPICRNILNLQNFER